MTELDDAIEQLLARYIPDAHQRIQARNGICALITTAGGNPAAPVPQPDELLARIAATLDDCDATQLPTIGLPKIAHTFRVPRQMVEATPLRIDDHLMAEAETRIDHATSPPPCCDLHNQHCEVPADLCCDACPEVVALAQFVAAHQRGVQREHQALVDAIDQHTRKHRSRIVNWLLRRGSAP